MGPEGTLRKTKLCRFYGTGSCARGESCTFAHSRADLSRRPNLRKTQLCLAFERNGACRDGAACRYAHGMHELRGSPPNMDVMPNMQQQMLLASLAPTAAGLAPNAEIMAQLLLAQTDFNGALAPPLPVGLRQSDAPTNQPPYNAFGAANPASAILEQFISASTSQGEVKAMQYGSEVSTKSTLSTIDSDDASSGGDSSQEINQPAKMPDTVFHKTKMCKFFANGMCTKGDKCGFAHERGAIRVRPDLYRTRLCLTFTRTGKCEDGDNCRFAHGVDQLRATSEEVLAQQMAEQKAAVYDADNSNASELQEPLFVRLTSGGVCLVGADDAHTSRN